ncbi:hypothetical protein Moror_5189 [Moniliophthora roreri MCA 2997]|uniref:Uncharacterized protein n=1 Tax=Moniliophthora roreri (strain MCA 2997) TaxID=1381753 RepID=V2WQV6_MONRO|nr:hypothetical protein Moror_5189 [Moniliophthora roreri MCA 2997]
MVPVDDRKGYMIGHLRGLQCITFHISGGKEEGQGATDSERDAISGVLNRVGHTLETVSSINLELVTFVVDGVVASDAWDGLDVVLSFRKFDATLTFHTAGGLRADPMSWPTSWQADLFSAVLTHLRNTLETVSSRHLKTVTFIMDDLVTADAWGELDIILSSGIFHDVSKQIIVVSKQDIDIDTHAFRKFLCRCDEQDKLSVTKLYKSHSSSYVNMLETRII